MERDRPALCVHHWILSEPGRGSIKGICRRCGARRTYPAGLELPTISPEEEELDLDLSMLAAALSSEQHALV